MIAGFGSVLESEIKCNLMLGYGDVASTAEVQLKAVQPSTMSCHSRTHPLKLGKTGIR